MNRNFFRLIAVAVFGASSLLGQDLAFGGGTCCPEPSCCPEAGCNNGCGCKDCHEYCPRCGCRLEPVCHPTCEVKKETIHKYCCTCKDICIPHVTPLCEAGCKNGCESGACAGSAAGGCEAGCDPKGCDDCCGCRVRTVHKLLVCPVTKEHCVKGCTVTWTCPKCGDCCGGCEVAPAVKAPAAAPAAPTAPAPAPNTSRLPPAPKTTEVAPLPQDIGVAKAGF